MSSSPGSSKLLPRGRSPHGPTKTAWTTRCDHLLPRAEFIGRTRSGGHKPKHNTVATMPTEDIGQVPIRSIRADRSFMWRDFNIPEDGQEPEVQTVETQDTIKDSDIKDIPTDPVQPQDHSNDQCVAIEEDDPSFEHSVTVDSKVLEKKVLLKRQSSCDSLFTGKHIKPDAVWTPYGPPLYGYGSSLNPPRRKVPDTLVILAAIFYCLAALTAVVFAVLLKTNVLSVYTPPEPVPAWFQQFSPEMQRWYRLALAGGRDASAILPPGIVQQPTEEPPVEESCGNTSLPALRHGNFNCTSIAYYNIHVRMCSARCHVGYRTDDAGLLFCNRGRWAPIRPEVVSTLVGVGRAADAMPNTDPRVFEYLGITDEIYADVALNILVKLDQVPNLSIVKTYLDMISEDNIIDFDMMRQLLIWVGPNIDDIVANLNFPEVLSRLETFGATRHPVCRIVDCGWEHKNLDHGMINSSTTTYKSDAILVCDRGYLPRHPVLTCEATGQWDKPALCDPVTCSPPEDPPHGSYLCQGHVFSDRCDVICDVGYVPETDDSLGCSWTGNWTAFSSGNTTQMENDILAALRSVVGGGSDLFCQKKDCGRFATPANGVLTCSGTRYQDSCRLACEPGYKVGDESGHLLHSLHNFSCLASGQWNNKPKCVPSDYCRLDLHDCHPEHGICILTGHQAFSCRCRVGTVGDGRRCERTACPRFPMADPENGFFTCSIPASSAVHACQSASSTAAEYEVVCVLHCNPGYDRLIYAEYSCGPDGNWTIPVDINSPGTTPCLAVKCPDLGSPQNGGMTCDSGSNFRYPEACNFACDRGYELSSTSSSLRHCQTDATWSGNDTVCIGVQCPALSSPTNGRISCDNGSSFRHPENCSFTCDPGYELHVSGSNSRTCRADGTWSGSDVTCNAPDNRGTEFMVGFLQNLDNTQQLELFITSASSSPASVNISAPFAGFTRRLAVTDSAVQVVSLPQSLALSGNERAQKGISITSDTEIIVYGVNKRFASTDGFLGLPKDVLGTEYFVASYIRSSLPSEFGIFGTEDNTDVEITLRGTTQYQGVTYSTGSVIRLVLNKIEAIQFQGSDLTGTRITSNKPITLMSGVQCAQVPVNIGNRDHLVEQIPPVDTWGKRFVTVPLAGRTGGDIFRIVAARDSTAVNVTGQAGRSLDSGEFWELDVPSDVYQVITSSKPIMVLQYNKGQRDDAGPLMMYLPPIEHFAADYTFATVDAVGSVFDSYINVVIKTSEKSGLLYDGRALPSSTPWVQIPGTDLSAAQLHISRTGTHKIKHSSAIVTFAVFYYGYSLYDSVGFPGGMRFEQVSSNP
ncbi:FCGBP [Branchiostoma lanceolatum]|uniref:FCGBP protein n=1 Tax=Branchiostoma lanceolatum TaxID=7740 RepID=A0A8K0AHB4_BRALA|nr:FCGBP [Branchiostoma lanceolatum]